MATPTIRATHAIRRIERAKRRFNVRALGKLYPDLPGPSLAEALLREQRLDRIYEQRMATRLRQGFRRLGLDPTLSAQERQQKEAKLLEQEQRFLRMHIAAAQNRMLREAEMQRLQRSGEQGAYWLIDWSKRTHTADCLAMEGRYWSWDVLGKINPANRHAGCGCRLISIQEARNRGLAVRRGYRSRAMRAATELRESDATPVELVTFVEDYAEFFPHHEQQALCFGCGKRFRRLREDALPTHCGRRMLLGPEPLLEAVIVHVQGYWRKGKSGQTEFVRGYTRRGEGVTVQVPGEIPAIYDADVQALVAAAEKGDLTSVRDAHRNLRKLLSQHAKGETTGPGAEERRLALRTLDRLYRTAVDPTMRRRTVGERVEVGERTTPVPLAPVEQQGVQGAWSKKGSFQWRVPKANVPLASLRKRRIRVREQDDAVVIEVPGGSSRLARQLARNLEIAYPQLRSARQVEPGVLLDDDAPIDIQADEMGKKAWRQAQTRPTVYPGVERDRLGDAAEVLVGDVRDRMLELGLIDQDDSEWHWMTAGGSNTPLDWEIDSMLVEVKGKSWRGVTAGPSVDLPSAPGIGAASDVDEKGQLERKREMLAKRNRERRAQGLGPLKPVIVQMFVDLDNDVSHVVYQPHRGKLSDAYISQRVPQQLVFDLMAGEISPGQVAKARTGSANTWYLGSFRLRLNPTRGDEVGKRHDKAELERVAAQKPAPAAADLVPEGARMDAPVARARAAKPKGPPKSVQVEREVVKLARQVNAGKSDIRSQGELAARVGISQGRVSQILKAAGVKWKPKPRRVEESDLVATH